MPLSGAANVVAIFLSTPSTRRATRLPGGLGRVPDISIHALREEGDKAGEPVTIPINDFYPRPPRGGRPFALASHILVTDFYPRPPRGGRPVALPNEPGNRFISIHALREEGDVKGWLRATEVTRFLSTPSARRATLPLFRASENSDFYPRPPRGGRLHTRKSMSWSCDFYPRPPRGGRRGCFFSWRRCPTISIHALREEGDQVCHAGRSKQHNFYPRPPRGGRPGSLLRRYKHEYFYPRPPRGGRPASSAFWVAVEEFLSTPSARRATKNPLMVI